MKDILEVVPFDTFLAVEEFEEFLDELGGHVDFEGFDVDSLVDDELEEELVDALEVGPGGGNFFFLFDSSFRKTQVALFYVGQRPENVFLYHLHHFVQVRNY